MKDLKYEHQSGWVVGWLEGSWVGGGGVGGCRVHGVSECSGVGGGGVHGRVVGGFMGWVHILTTHEQLQCKNIATP